MFKQEDFDHYFSLNPSTKYSLSLLDFYKTCVSDKIIKNSSVLELGCGNYSIFEDVTDNFLDITAIDFSKVAIENAPKSKVEYRQISVTDSSFFEESKFDLIFDSHCLNCIPSEDFFGVLTNIFGSLKPNGIFASELMVQPDRFKIVSPNKTIYDCREVEMKLIEIGLKINYFIVSTSCNFEVDGMKVDLLRFVARK
jgi:2-polyprenyl-3-methyl-5-hydroxy-6-metoxy-1,4-benzoquinol methylase